MTTFDRFMISVDHEEPVTIRQFIQTNVLDQDVEHITPRDLIAVLKLQPGEKTFVGLVEVQRTL